MIIWLDLDGVMANFDLHYERLFGVKPKRWPEPKSVDWKLVQSVPDFFRTMPLMPGARQLFTFCRQHGDTRFLTGCPKNVDSADNQKRDWGIDNFPEIKMVCCRARHKFIHGNPGDILIDDYLRYRYLWEDMGGIFIHHTSAQNSIDALTRMIRQGKLK